jgi:hypothetical protein
MAESSPDDVPGAEDLRRVIRTNLAGWSETVPAPELIQPHSTKVTKGNPAGFSTDGEVLAVAGDGVRLYRTSTGRLVEPVLPIDGTPTAAVFDPNGQSRLGWAVCSVPRVVGRTRGSSTNARPVRARGGR